MIEFQESAERDDVRALNYLGIMYAEGIGTPRDDNKAATMFTKAALLGFPEAMANMGRIHANGRGVPQDNQAAVAAFSAAARSGFQPAISRMVMIYEKGELGVAPDAAQADTWRAGLSTQPVQSTPAAAAPPQAATPEPETIAPAAATLPLVAVAVAAVATIPAAPPPEPIAEQQTQTADTAPTPTPAQNVIESIAVTLQSGEIQIRVRTRTPLAAPPADFVMVTPPRIVFDFPHTGTGLGRYHEVGEGDLQSVDVIAGDSRTRMVLILRNGMQHDARMDDGHLLIRLTPASAPASSSAGNPPRRSGR